MISFCGGVWLSIGNTAADGGPLNIDTIQAADVPTAYSIEDLSWDGLEGVDWDVTYTDVHGGLPSWLHFPGLWLPHGGAIVYRVNAVWFDQDPENVVEYAGQYVPEPASFTLLGLGGLALLGLYRAR